MVATEMITTLGYQILGDVTLGVGLRYVFRTFQCSVILVATRRMQGWLALWSF